MKWIHLGHEYFACVSDEDYEKVSCYIWRHASPGYARTHQVHFGGIDVFLHEFLMGKSDGNEVDHVNRAKWDNRRQNLRSIPRWQNQRNKGMPLNAPYPTEQEMLDAIAQRLILKKSQNFLSIASRRNANWIKREVNRVCRKVKDSQGNVFSSPKEAGRYYGAPNGSNILECCKGKKKSAYGQRWQFVD